jgi:hypothetical protein
MFCPALTVTQPWTQAWRMAAAIWAAVGGAGVVLPRLPDGAPLPEVGLLGRFVPDPPVGVDDEG